MRLQCTLSHRVLPLDPGGEAVGQFVEGTRILAFNLAPAPKVISQLLQLLALLLQLQVKNLQLVHKLTAHLWKEWRDKTWLLKWFAGSEKAHTAPFPLRKKQACWQLLNRRRTRRIVRDGLHYLWFVSHSPPIQRALSGVLHEKSFWRVLEVWVQDVKILSNSPVHLFCAQLNQIFVGWSVTSRNKSAYTHPVACKEAF